MFFFSRANNARSKAHSAEIYAKQARSDSIEARAAARAAAPDFRQPGYFKKKFIFFVFLFPLLGEDKPQTFIPLDIDRQVDGKLIIGNHINVSPPNGRLPVTPNHIPHPSMPVPPHLSPHQSSPATPPLILDGGVYQGQPPTTQASDWNANTKVKGFIFHKKFNFFFWEFR